MVPSGFGAMNLSIAGRPDRRQAIETIHAALDAANCLVETADAYCLHDSDTGHNEALVAEALASWRGLARRPIPRLGATRRPGHGVTGGRPRARATTRRCPAAECRRDAWLWRGCGPRARP
jgi:Aldo/keto reductase family